MRIVVGVYGLLLSFVLQGQPVVAQGTANAVTWEYTWTVNGRDKNGEKMNEFGKFGWEMVAVIITPGKFGDDSVEYYKRRKN